MQPLRLIYNSQCVVKKRAVIFINDGINRVAEMNLDQQIEELCAVMQKENEKPIVKKKIKKDLKKDSDQKKQLMKEKFQLKWNDAKLKGEKLKFLLEN